MWSAADPCTGEHGPRGLYGEPLSGLHAGATDDPKTGTFRFPSHVKLFIGLKKMTRNAKILTSRELSACLSIDLLTALPLHESVGI